MQSAAPATPSGPQLRDLHLPGEPSWFPPAPGWWLLAILSLALLIFLFLWLRKRRRHRRWAGAAKREWMALKNQYEQGAEASECLRTLSALVRRAALRVEPAVARLSGDDWAQWLDLQLGRPAFVDGEGRVLIDGPYRPQAPAELSVVINLSGEVIKQLERRL